MGCLQLPYQPLFEQKYPSALRVVHNKYRPNPIHQNQEVEPKTIIVFFRVWTDEKGQILRVDCYVLNNPLKYTDPSGEFVFSAIIPVAGIFIDAALWGAVLGGAGYTASVAFSDGGFQNWNGNQFWTSVGVGAISGAATAGIGFGFGGVSGFGNELARAGAHGLVNGGLSELQGGSFGSGFVSGTIGSLAGSGFQAWGGKFAQSGFGTVSFSAIGGGVGSELSGGNFWRGAATGATVGLLNHSSANLKNAIYKKTGFFALNRQHGVHYIYANTNEVEMGLVEFDNKNGKKRYFVTPWDKNTKESTVFDTSKIPGIRKGSNWYKYHTHTTYSGPGIDDAYNRLQNPYWKDSFVISKSEVWRVGKYGPDYGAVGIIRPPGHYGEVISPVSNWLNGRFTGF